MKILFLKHPPHLRDPWAKDMMEAIDRRHEVIEFNEDAPLAPQFQAVDFVIDQGGNSIDVSALAEKRDMSRSHFSHYFKATTGMSPAKFIADVRLEQVSRRLVETSDKLGVIARDAGFADATHLCKVFRRHFHTSPGDYRRQLRG